MINTAFARPPGLYDRLPDEFAEAREVIGKLQAAMTRFGYQIVETPLVEFADLFLTKSGDDAVNRLFHFELRGRHLCLRSEFTPSAVRLYVERFQHEPKPIRWQFAGPVFRYESPQRSHSRQFTMLGTELIGATGISGDAETIGMATQGLISIGLREWILHIGHVGLVSQLLDRFALDRRVKRFLLGQIENLRRPDRGRDYVEEQVRQLYAGLPTLPVAGKEANEDDEAASMTQTISLLLESANLVMPSASRTPQEIAQRLLKKQRRASHHQDTLKAIDFLDRLTRINDVPDRAFAEIDALIADLASDKELQTTVNTFRQTVALLEAYGIPSSQVHIAMGMARGLNYYTGIVFEVHTLTGDSSSQLCGGGRYDDFIRVTGAAKDTPAVGFAYGLERLLQELHRLGQQTAPAQRVAATIVPLDEADSFTAAQLATRLREAVNIDLYPPPVRNLTQTLTRLGKQGVPFVFIIGEAERAADQISVRDMRTGQQSTCTLDTALAAITGAINEP